MEKGLRTCARIPPMNFICANRTVDGYLFSKIKFQHNRPSRDLTNMQQNNCFVTPTPPLISGTRYVARLLVILYGISIIHGYRGDRASKKENRLSSRRRVPERLPKALLVRAGSGRAYFIFSFDTAHRPRFVGRS